MREYTEGTIRKKQRGDGSWVWCAIVSYKEDGKRRQVTKVLGIECDPLTDEERAASKGNKAITPTGKGATKALAEFKAWRESLVQAERDAEERKAQEEAEAAALAALPKCSRMKVPEFVQEYVNNKEVSNHATGAMGIEASTLDNYKFVIRHLRYPELDVEARHLTPARVQAWVKATNENGVGASMRAKSFSLLKYACAWGIQMGYISAPNPCAAIKAPVKRERDRNPLDEAELARLNTLLDSLDGDEAKRTLADAVRIAIHTGMRQGEICGLRWKDIDHWNDGEAWKRPWAWNNGEADEITGYLSVSNVIADAGSGKGLYAKPYPKGRRKRYIPIMPELAEALARRRVLAMEECVALGVPFTGELYVLGRAVSPEEAGKGFYSPDYLGHQWSMFAGLMNITGRAGMRAHFHDLRHTFAVHYLVNGIPLATVSAILGHANSATTARYYEDFLTEAQRDAMWRMHTKMAAKSKKGDVVQFRPSGTEG